MLPFFARILTRREMALGCAVLSLALLLSTPACCSALGAGTAGHRGPPLCRHPALPHPGRQRFPCRPDRQARRAGCCSGLRRCPLHRAGQACRPALGGREPARTGADGPGRAGKAGGIFSTVTVQLVEMYFDTTRYSTGILPAGRYLALRIDLGGNARHGKNWWCVLYPGLCRSACGTYAPAGGKRSGVWVVCGAVQMRGMVAAGDGKPGG